MTDQLVTAKQYFVLSNESDLDAIAAMFTESSTYSSENTGVYLGREQIMTMMRAFHESFSELHWEVQSTEKVRPGVIKFVFTFVGTKKSGEKVESSGVEYVIVHDGKLQHIEVRNG